MKFSENGSIVKYDAKYKNCTVDIDGAWFPCFVPDTLAEQIKVGENCEIGFSLKCKFEKGKKPYVYLVLKGVHYE